MMDRILQISLAALALILTALPAESEVLRVFTQSGQLRYVGEIEKGEWLLIELDPKTHTDLQVVLVNKVTDQTLTLSHKNGYSCSSDIPSGSWEIKDSNVTSTIAKISIVRTCPTLLAESESLRATMGRMNAAANGGAAAAGGGSAATTGAATVGAGATGTVATGAAVTTGAVAATSGTVLGVTVATAGAIGVAAAATTIVAVDQIDEKGAPISPSS